MRKSKFSCARTVEVGFIFLSFLFVFFFFRISPVSAVDYYFGFPPGWESCACPGGPAYNVCWNSQSAGVTDCGQGCGGGDPWKKYSFSQCISVNFTCGFGFLISDNTCSTGDKYDSSNPPVMDAGRCSVTSGSCDVGGGYKTCCSGTTQVGANHFQVDLYAPDEADCGGYSTVYCGGGGQPACGQASCDTLAPPCNSGIWCNGVCTAPANTCGTDNGTQGDCAYTTYTEGGICNLTSAPDQSCTINNCNSGYTCQGGSCVVVSTPTPTPTTPPGVTPTPTPTPTPVTCTISGIVYVDSNNDGIKQAGESYYSGATVKRVPPAGGTTTTTTASNPSYSFTSVPSGAIYTVSISNTGAYSSPNKSANCTSAGGTITANFPLTTAPTPTPTPTPPPGATPTPTPTPPPSCSGSNQIVCNGICNTCPSGTFPVTCDGSNAVCCPSGYLNVCLSTPGICYGSCPVGESFFCDATGGHCTGVGAGGPPDLDWSFIYIRHQSGVIVDTTNPAAPGESLRAQLPYDELNDVSASGFYNFFWRDRASAPSGCSTSGFTVQSPQQSIPAGTSVTWWADFTAPSTNGTYTAWHYIDGNCNVAETSEANNTRSRSYVVGLPLLSPTPTPTPTYNISGNVFVDTNKDGLKNGTEANYTGSITITSSPTGTVSYPASGQFTVSNLAAGTYTVSYTNLPSGYQIINPTTGPPPYFSVGVGPSVSNINFAIAPYGPWIQSTGADIRLDKGFNYYIPASATCGSYASLNGGGSTNGFIFTGGTNASFGGGRAGQSTNWVVGGSSAQNQELFTPTKGNVIRTSYNYINAQIKQAGLTLTPLASGCNLSSGCSLTTLGHGLYSSSSVAYINASTLNCTNGASAGNCVFLINGNLNILGNITVNPGATATFIVSGDIIVNQSVGETTPSSTTPNIEGFYSTDKNFIASTTNICPTADKRLNIRGSVVVNAGLGGGTFQNLRDLCGGNATCPVFSIQERPDFILNAPEVIKRQNAIYQEVAP